MKKSPARKRITVLFKKDTPFKPKVIKSKKIYCRKAKNVRQIKNEFA